METGADKMKSGIHHFADGDVGGLINVSGAAMLKASRNQAAAQKFLAFLVSKPAQQLLSNSTSPSNILWRLGVAANPALKPMTELSPPN